MKIPCCPMQNIKKLDLNERDKIYNGDQLVKPLG